MKRKKQGPSEATILLHQHLEELDYEYAMEYKFHPSRKWRFDFCVLARGKKVAIEIDGGSWIQGRHNTGSGSAKDREKFNEAARLGWLVVKFTPAEVLKGTAIAFIRKVLET